MLSSKKGEHKGVIINWTSTAGFVDISGGTGDLSSYMISKHAINGLTKSMASAYGKDGIRVNAVAPGYVIFSRLSSSGQFE